MTSNNRVQQIIIFNDSDLMNELVQTNGYELYFKPWLYGHYTNWTINTFNNILYSKKISFLILVDCFFCCLGCGLEDYTSGYQMYDESMTIDIVLTLLLKTSMAIKNNPESTNDCWLATTNIEEPYLYVTTSTKIPGQNRKKERSHSGLKQFG